MKLAIGIVGQSVVAWRFVRDGYRIPVSSRDQKSDHHRCSNSLFSDCYVCINVFCEDSR